MRRAHHVGSAIVLLALAAFATWNVIHNADWREAVLPFSPGYRADVSTACGLAVIWWAGGLGLLTRTTVGLWLGRLGAAVLPVLGAWLVWDQVVNPSGSRLYGDPLLIAVPLAVILAGAGLGILVALRPRASAGTTDSTGRRR